MNTPARLAIYGACLVAAFSASFAIASAVVPPELVAEHGTVIENAHGGHGEESGAAEALPGLSLSSGGYTLEPIEAPGHVGESGTFSFTVTDAEGEPLTEYETEHEKDLHLIVVRSDGEQFHHVHPTLGADGTWSIPWVWHEPGTYRAFADFVPHGGESGITLSRTVHVAGEFEPAPVTAEKREFEVGGFTVRLEGELTVGGESTLTAEVLRDGAPVETIEPYLGAFGHLVALRDGDLAYLHVHPTGADPQPGELSGPHVSFATEAPTPGRYLLYFDFQVEGTTHSAMFVLTASGTHSGDSEAGSHSDEEEGH